MKLLKTSIATLFALVCISCGDGFNIIYDQSFLYTQWIVENHTGQTIYVRFFTDFDRMPIAPDDNFYLATRQHKWKEKADFYQIDTLNQPTPTSIAIYLDPESEPVKEWFRADAEADGRQLFDDDEWHFFDKEKSERCRQWIFELTADDLQ